MARLAELNQQIEGLLRERSKLLVENDYGFTERYTVFDNIAGSFESEVLVVSPKESSADIAAVQEYCKNLKNPVLRRALLDWLREFTEFKCVTPQRGVCSISKSPVCCLYCSRNTKCLMDDEPHLCPLVACGEVENIEDCSEKGDDCV